jgi:hypothetical protein
MFGPLFEELLSRLDHIAQWTGETIDLAIVNQNDRFVGGSVQIAPHGAVFPLVGEDVLPEKAEEFRRSCSCMKVTVRKDSTIQAMRAALTGEDRYHLEHMPWLVVAHAEHDTSSAFIVIGSPQDAESFDHRARAAVLPTALWKLEVVPAPEEQPQQ